MTSGTVTGQLPGTEEACGMLSTSIKDRASSAVGVLVAYE